MLEVTTASSLSSQPGSKMVSSAKSSVPTVTDQAAAMQLGQCAKNLATSLAELRTAAQKVMDRSTRIFREYKLHMHNQIERPFVI